MNRKGGRGMVRKSSQVKRARDGLLRVNSEEICGLRKAVPKPRSVPPLKSILHMDKQFKINKILWTIVMMVNLFKIHRKNQEVVFQRTDPRKLLKILVIMLGLRYLKKSQQLQLIHLFNQDKPVKNLITVSPNLHLLQKLLSLMLWQLLHHLK